MHDVNGDARGGFRRIGILTGPDRRRRWSVEDKARIVEETLAPGAQVTEVARRWQLRPQQVFAWRREAREVIAATPDAAGVAGFVPIVAQDAPAAIAPHGRRRRPSSRSSLPAPSCAWSADGTTVRS